MDRILFEKGDRKLDNIIASIVFNRILFVQCYMVFLFLYNIQWLGEIITEIHPLLIIWAAIIIFHDMFILKVSFKVPYAWLLFFTVVASGITVILNIRVDPVTMVKFIIQNIIQLFAIYPVLFLEEKENLLIFKKIGLPLILGSFLSSLLSLLVFFTFIQWTVTIGTRKFAIGFLEHTYLRGIYIDSNTAALVAVISILFSVFIIIDARTKPKKGWSLFCKINIVTQFFYFVLANSRGAELSMIFSVFIVLNFVFVLKNIKAHNIFRAILSIILAVSVAVGIYFCYHGIQKILTDINAVTHSFFSNSENPDDTTTSIKEEANRIAQFERKNSGSDISSGRIGIWKEAFQLYAHNPIFGIGQNNRAFYATKYDIQGIIKNGKAVHNSYIDLLVCYGAVGFLIFAFFYTIVGFRIVKYEWEVSDKNPTYYLALFGICFLAASAFFLTTIFTYNTLMYSVFLFFTAYIVKKFKSSES